MNEKYKYLVLTEHLPDYKIFKPNIDIVTGPFIRLDKKSGVDLLKEPFNLKVKEVNDICKIRPKKIKDFERVNIGLTDRICKLLRGLDFNKVTLVGVVLADALLNFQDFRALRIAATFPNIVGSIGFVGFLGLLVHFGLQFTDVLEEHLNGATL